MSEKKINPRREELKAISAPLRALVKNGALDSVNEGLASIYRQQGHTTLKTFNQWKEEGKSVVKGEKALLLWGSPKDLKKVKEAQESGASDDDVAQFFPVCYVFSQKQVA